MTTQINRDAIVKVYSGRPGCGCGCRGRYFEDARNITRVVNAMNKRADEVTESTTKGFPTVFFVENDTRYYWAYTA